MFTVKIEYKDRDEMYPAAKVTRRGRTLDLYAPRTETAYVLPGDVVHEVNLDDEKLLQVFVTNAHGKTVDRYWGPPTY